MLKVLKLFLKNLLFIAGVVIASGLEAVGLTAVPIYLATTGGRPILAVVIFFVSTVVFIAAMKTKADLK
jgi:hypothetical protein